MLRSLWYTTGALALAGACLVPTAATAQTDTRPVVVVFRFDNNSIGAGRADFDGMATGIQDLLITDLASNPDIRLVDRAHLNEILAEQNLTRTGQVDASTAVRLGKILGAQYAVTGGFLSDGRGSAVLTGRTIDIETTQIANPQKISGKTDDVLGLITRLSSSLSKSLELAPKPGAPAGGAGTRGAGAASSASRPAQRTEFYSKPLTRPQSMKVRLDVATMKLYSNALDELDRKNVDRARELFQQVLNKYPSFEPAERNLHELSGRNGQ